MYFSSDYEEGWKRPAGKASFRIDLNTSIQKDISEILDSKSLVRQFKNKVSGIYYCVECGRELEYEEYIIAYSGRTGQPSNWRHIISCGNIDCPEHYEYIMDWNSNKSLKGRY